VERLSVGEKLKPSAKLHLNSETDSRTTQKQILLGLLQRHSCFFKSISFPDGQARLLVLRCLRPWCESVFTEMKK